MKERILTFLLLALVNITLVAQETVMDSVLIKKYINAGWKFSPLEKRYVEFEVSDTICSANQNNKLIRHFVGVGDNVTKAQYYLVRTQVEDTIKILTTEFRDAFQPNAGWILSNYLIYEERGYSNNKIHLRNLDTNENEFSVSGEIPVDSNDFESFIDRKNQVLIFFQYGNNDNEYISDLMSIDLKNRKVKKLLTFNSPFGFEVPVVKLDTERRILKVNNGDFVMYELKEVQVEY
ncbi:hypothetical protein [Carboxylicivirga caseinilyticus]|uniref:hypothetical protein n=1 Tax=Carboxylicivirga caseinilyticus TaxID=3417572 RepID=UPI003D332088|nr:hypothetical protein [Marinilabiliaceae bacterium A049]